MPFQNHCMCREIAWDFDLGQGAKPTEVTLEISRWNATGNLADTRCWGAGGVVVQNSHFYHSIRWLITFSAIELVVANPVSTKCHAVGWSPGIPCVPEGEILGTSRRGAAQSIATSVLSSELTPGLVLREIQQATSKRIPKRDRNSLGWIRFNRSNLK